MDTKSFSDRIEDILEDMCKVIKSNILFETVESTGPLDTLTAEDVIKYYSTVAKNVSYKHQVLVTMLKSLEVTRDELLYTIETLMHSIDLNELETDDIRIKFRKCPIKVLIHDESKIDVAYFYNKKTLDRKLIADHLKNGLSIEGAELIQEERIDIKYKKIKAKEHV